MMPSHPNRVRRNYHTVIIAEKENIPEMEHTIIIGVTRAKIASAISKRELKHMIWKEIEKGVDKQYKGTN